MEARSKSRSLGEEESQVIKLERGLILKEETKKLKEILDMKTRMTEEQREAREAEKRAEEEQKKLNMEADAVVSPKKRNSLESLRHNPNHVSQYQNSMSGRGGEDSDESDDDIEILRRGGSARVLAPSIGVKAMPPSMLVPPEPVQQPKSNFANERLYAKEDDEQDASARSPSNSVPKVKPRSEASKARATEYVPPPPSDPRVGLI